MFTFALEYKEDKFKFQGLDFLEKISFDLIVNLDNLTEPLTRLSFTHPPHYQLPEYNWFHFRQALLKAEETCLYLDNNQGVTILELLPNGLVLRTLINCEGINEGDPKILRDYRNQHDGCHVHIPIDTYSRQILINIVDKIIDLCHKFDHD